VLSTVPLLILGYDVIGIAGSQETSTTQAQELIQLAEEGVAETMKNLPAGSILPPPSAAGITSALNLFSTSPLTGSGIQESGTGTGSLSPNSGATTNQSPPPYTIQLPPPPPEKYAPPAQWRPPIQIPNPSTITSPPLAQAPQQQWRPPIEMPNPSSGTTGAQPIQLPIIPLPPHPPEEQAPWNKGG